MDWLRGYVCCRLDTPFVERFLNLCRHNKIKLKYIVYESDGIRFCIYIKDYKKLIKISRKIKAVPHIVEKRGVPFWSARAKRRWAFVVGCLLFVVVLFVLSSFVWRIEISGQSAYTKETILKALNEFHVETGMLRSNIDGKAIEDYIRKKYPEISWVSAEEVGCRLIIKIKEGKDVLTKQPEVVFSHLIASCDGTVESIVTAQGTPKVKKGSKVKKGDILIFGGVNILDDAKEVVEIVPKEAEGSVIIRTECNLENMIPTNYQKKEYNGKHIDMYEITFFNNSFAVKNPLKRFDKSYKYDIITKVCANQMDSGIPYRVIKRSALAYRIVSAKRSKQESIDMAKQLLSEFLQQKIKEKCTIVEKKATLYPTKTGYLQKSHVIMLVPQTEKKKATENDWSVKKPNGKDGENP